MSMIDSFEYLFENLKQVPDFYNTITEISKSQENPPRPAVNDKRKIFWMDNLCKNVHYNIKYVQGNPHSTHSSVDGFYYILNKNKLVLIFVEFKIVDSSIGTNRTYRDYLKSKIKPKLRIKPLETLNCVLPHLFEQYSFNEEGLQKLLFEAPKYYFSVIYDPSCVNEANARQALGSDFIDLNRLSHFPFKVAKAITPDRFQEIMDTLIQP